MRHDAYSNIVKSCVALLVVIILLAAGFLLFFTGSKTKEVTVSKSVSEVVEDTVTADNHIDPIFPVKLSSVKFVLNEGELDFSMELSSWTAYIVEFSDEHKTLELTLYNTDVEFQQAPPQLEQAEDKKAQKESSQIINGLKVLGDIKEQDITLENYSVGTDTVLRLNFPYSVHLVKSKIMKGNPSSLLLTSVRSFC